MNMKTLAMLTGLFFTSGAYAATSPKTLSCNGYYDRQGNTETISISEKLKPSENHELPRFLANVEKTTSDGRFQIFVQALQPLKEDPIFKENENRVSFEVVDRQLYTTVAPGDYIGLDWGRFALSIKSGGDLASPVTHSLAVTCWLK